MGTLGILGMAGRIIGKVCTALRGVALTGLHAAIACQPYRAITKDRLTQLEDCEATLKVVIGQGEQHRAARSDRVHQVVRP